MGCLFKRNKIWYFIVYEKGKQVWRSLHTDDEQEARVLSNDYTKKQKAIKRCCLSAFSEDFQRNSRSSLADKTIKMYDSAFRNFIRLCGDGPIRRITPVDAENFKRLRSEEVRAVSVNIEIRTLRAGFNYAKRLKLVDENAFNGIKTLRVPFREAAFLSEDEVRVLLGVIDDDWFRNLIIFVIVTMTRRGEVINLQWTDVDMIRKIIVVKSRGDFEVKGGKPRIIPMNPWVYDFLTKLPRTGNWVFPGEGGKPLNGSTLTHKFKRYVRRAAINAEIHFHSLRHTAISLLVNRGVHQPFVQRIAGHSSLAMTEIYTHVVDRNLIDAVAAFPSLTVGQEERQSVCL